MLIHDVGSSHAWHSTKEYFLHIRYGHTDMLEHKLILLKTNQDRDPNVFHSLSNKVLGVVFHERNDDIGVSVCSIVLSR